MTNFLDTLKNPFLAGAKFFDWRGNEDPPRNAAALAAADRKAEAGTKTQPYRGPLYQRSTPEEEMERFNKFREQFNPLKGLTMQKAVSHLEAGERGEFSELQWLYRTIEKRDAVLRGGKRNLLAAVGERDWDIHPIAEPPPGYTPAQVEAQLNVLRNAYNRIENLAEAIAWLALAEFRGFAHLEKNYAQDGQNDGAIVRLQPVPQWYMGRDSQTSPWRYDPRAANGINKGVQINPADFVIREVEDPINEIALIAFVRKNLSKKDWDGFVESFGIPSIFIELPPSSSAEDAAKYQQVAEQIISDARGTMPNGGKVHALDTGSRGTNPFQQHLDYQDGEIAMAITSGALTMLHASGTGTLAGGAHSETFKRVASALCGRIDEAFQAQFDKPLLAELFPGQPALAFFRLSSGEEETAEDFVAGVKTLKEAGYTVDPAQVEEKTNFKLTATAALAPVDQTKERLATAAPVAEAALPAASEIPATAGALAETTSPAGAVKPALSAPAPAAKTVTPPANLSVDEWSGALDTRAEVLSPVLSQLNHLVDLANDPTVTDTALQQAVDEAAAAIPGTPVNPEALANVLETFMAQGAADALSQPKK